MSRSSATLPASIQGQRRGKLMTTESLIDTSFLTAEEKRAIQKVIEEDIKYNKEVLCSLEIAVYNGREFQSLQSNSSQKMVLCSCCGSARTICDKLRGYKCYQCGNSVCKTCIAMGTKKILCNVCYKERMLDLQMRNFDLSDLDGKKDDLYGSELLQVSISKQVLKKDTTLKIFHLPPEASKAPEVSKLMDQNASSTLPRDHRLNIPSVDDINSGFKLIKSSVDDNLAEISSLYSEPCYTDYRVSGEVSFGVWYREDENTLYVRIVKVKNLGTVQGSVVNPYIKTYLLPGKSKHTKRKTAIQRKTANPEYNEIIKYKMTTELISGTTLWLSVWNWNINGRNQFLGEVRLPLSSPSIDLTNPEDTKYLLCDKEEEKVETDAAQINGRICIALKFEVISRSKSPSPSTVVTDLSESLQSRRLTNALHPAGAASTQRRHSDLSSLSVTRPLSRLELGKLWIRVKSAENLRSIDTTGNNNPFVRCFLLPKITLGSKKKTKVVKGSLDPVWEEEFFYNFISCDELSTDRALEVTVWDNDRRGENSFMGGLRIGPDPQPDGPDWMDSTHEEVTHWQEMLDNQGGWVERWHTLRPSMNSLIAASKKGDDGISTAEGKVENKSSALLESSAVDSGDHTDGTTADEETEEGFKVLPKPLELNLTRREKGDHYEISGNVILAMEYKNNRLTVKVCKAQGLAGVNKNKTSNPYAKLYLLPDRDSKVKSKPKKKTLNPIFDQIFKFKISKKDLNDSSLWVTLWSYEGKFKHNQFLGETCIPFETHEFSESPEEISYKLNDYTKVDTIPNPALSRRRSTVYRVRATRRPQEGDEGGDRPTLYDSSLDLTAVPDDTQQNQAAKSDNEESINPIETDIDGEVIPQISVTSPLDHNKIDEPASNVSSTPVNPSDSKSIPQTSAAANSEKSSTTKVPKTSADRTTKNLDKSSKTSTATSSSKRPPPQPISKAKYTTITASTKPSKSRRIQTATSTPKAASNSKESSTLGLKEASIPKETSTPSLKETSTLKKAPSLEQELKEAATVDAESSSDDIYTTTTDFLTPQRSIKETAGRGERNDSIISIHGNLI